MRGLTDRWKWFLCRICRRAPQIAKVLLSRDWRKHPNHLLQAAKRLLSGAICGGRAARRLHPAKNILRAKAPREFFLRATGSTILLLPRACPDTFLRQKSAKAKLPQAYRAAAERGARW